MAKTFTDDRLLLPLDQPAPDPSLVGAPLVGDTPSREEARRFANASPDMARAISAIPAPTPETELRGPEEEEALASFKALANQLEPANFGDIRIPQPVPFGTLNAASLLDVASQPVVGAARKAGLLMQSAGDVLTGTAPGGINETVARGFDSVRPELAEKIRDQKPIKLSKIVGEALTSAGQKKLDQAAELEQLSDLGDSYLAKLAESGLQAVGEVGISLAPYVGARAGAAPIFRALGLGPAGVAGLSNVAGFSAASAALAPRGERKRAAKVGAFLGLGTSFASMLPGIQAHLAGAGLFGGTTIVDQMMSGVPLKDALLNPSVPTAIVLGGLLTSPRRGAPRPSPVKGRRAQLLLEGPRPRGLPFKDLPAARGRVFKEVPNSALNVETGKVELIPRPSPEMQVVATDLVRTGASPKEFVSKLKDQFGTGADAHMETLFRGGLEAVKGTARQDVKRTGRREPQPAKTVAEVVAGAVPRVEKRPGDKVKEVASTEEVKEGLVPTEVEVRQRIADIIRSDINDPSNWKHGFIRPKLNKAFGKGKFNYAKLISGVVDELKGLKPKVGTPPIQDIKSQTAIAMGAFRRANNKLLKMKDLGDDARQSLRRLKADFQIWNTSKKAFNWARRLKIHSERFGDFVIAPQDLKNAMRILNQAGKDKLRDLGPEGINTLTNSINEMIRAEEIAQQVHIGQRAIKLETATQNAKRNMAENAVSLGWLVKGEIKRFIGKPTGRISKVTEQMQFPVARFNPASIVWDVVSSSLSSAMTTADALFGRGSEAYKVIIEQQQHSLGVKDRLIQQAYDYIAQSNATRAELRAFEKRRPVEFPDLGPVEMTAYQMMDLYNSIQDPNTREILQMARYKGSYQKGAILKHPIRDLDWFEDEMRLNNPRLVEIAVRYQEAMRPLGEGLSQVLYDMRRKSLVLDPLYWPRLRHLIDSPDPDDLIKSILDQMQSYDQMSQVKLRHKSRQPFTVEDIRVRASRHINQTATAIAMWKSGEQARSLLRSVRDVAAKELPQGFDMVKRLEYATEVAMGLHRASTSPKADKALRWVIDQTTVGMLGFRAWIALYQTTSFLNALIDMPAKYRLTAIGGFFEPTGKLVNEMKEVSAKFRARAEGDPRLIFNPAGDNTFPLILPSKYTFNLNRASMGMIHRADMLARKGTYAAARAQGADEGWSSEKVVDVYEDRDARTQPSYGPLDSPYITLKARSNPWIRPFTMFTSATTKIWNQEMQGLNEYIRSKRTPADKAKFLALTGTLIIIGAALTTAWEEALFRALAFDDKFTDEDSKRVVSRFFDRASGLLLPMFYPIPKSIIEAFVTKGGARPNQSPLTRYSVGVVRASNAWAKHFSQVGVATWDLDTGILKNKGTLRRAIEASIGPLSILGAPGAAAGALKRMFREVEERRKKEQLPANVIFGL